MDVQEVGMARRLAAIEQALIAGLPADWESLAPPHRRTHEAATVLLRLAEAPDLDAMRAAAAEGVRCVEERRHDREADEAGFWRALRGLLAAIGDGGADRPRSLARLPLWGDTSVPAVLERIERSSEELDAAADDDEKTLTEVARILLRARARHWLVTERGKERASEEEEVPDGSND